MAERSICRNECKINSLPEERKAVCAKLAEEIVHQWWVGDLNATLHDVEMDIRFGERPKISDEEWETIDACMAEHSSNRCHALADLPGGHILDGENQE